MKAVMLSLRPQWCEKIFNGEKTIEVRKSRPKIDTPFEVLVYQTKITFKVRNWQENFQSIVFTPNGGAEDGNGKVIGSFVCDRIREIIPLGLRGFKLGAEWLKEMCLSKEQLDEYGGLKTLYSWHITEPTLFENPRELGEFRKPCDFTYDCLVCQRAVYKQLAAGEMIFNGCKDKITRPPQSWYYVEEME